MGAAAKTFAKKDNFRRSRGPATGAVVVLGSQAPPTKDWANLIDRVASTADREAFRLLFDNFAPKIKGFMIKNGLDCETAEEIAQETLILVWRKASLFNPATNGAAAWIFTIARNVRIDIVRRSSRVGKTLQSGNVDLQDGVAESVEVSLLDREDAKRITKALIALPEDQSIVLKMAFFEDRAHSEIADRLGIPLGTVKSRIRLAMKRLRDNLDDDR
jgi:RNA polymerase sigma factor (sigma-70 family)